MNEQQQRQPKEILSWDRQRDRRAQRVVDRLLGGRIRTTLTTFAVSGLAVTGLGLGAAAAMSGASDAPSHEIHAVVPSPDDGLWGGPDAVGRRLHAAHGRELWGGPDAVGRRIHAAYGRELWGGPDESRMGVRQSFSGAATRRGRRRPAGRVLRLLERPARGFAAR